MTQEQVTKVTKHLPKLSELHEMVETTLLVGAIRMAYLDEGGALHCAELSIEMERINTIQSTEEEN